jgi:hypothetical protein
MLLAVDRDALQIEVIGATKAVAGRVDKSKNESKNSRTSLSLYAFAFKSFSQFFHSLQKVFNIVNYSHYVKTRCRAALIAGNIVCLLFFILGLMITVLGLANRNANLRPRTTPKKRSLIVMFVFTKSSF